jgi:nucleotide-binding universal stress UspA family protein
MRTILFPTDFSKNAQHASEYMGVLAKQMNANITFLHIYSIPLVSEYNLPHEIESLIAQNRIAALEDLHQFVENFINETKIDKSKINTKVEYGFIPEKTVDIANQIKADFIVMGTKGASDAFDKWIGTVAQKVVKLAECPVWIIPEKAPIHYPKNIMYAADLTGDEAVATQKLLDIAKLFDANCNVVHIHEKIELNVGHQVEAMINFLADKFKHENATFRYVNRDDVTEGLEVYVKNHKPDVLALSTHKKSFFDKLFEKSVTKHFVQEAKMPILSFNK